jgi:hypothetical protein
LAGPAIGALGLGAGGAVLALALCFAVPAATLAWRRRGSRRAPAPEADDVSAPIIQAQDACASGQCMFTTI